jgi:hypothetical protein
MLLTDDGWRKNAREELGDIMFYMTWVCGILHVKLPTPTKLVKLAGTPADNLLTLNGLAIDLLDVHKKLYYGRTHDEEKAKEIMAKFVPLYYGVCNQLFGNAPVAFMIENQAKLSARYPEGFNPENEKFRNLKKEEAAAKKAQQATAKAAAPAGSPTSTAKIIGKKAVGKKAVGEVKEAPPKAVSEEATKPATA